MIEPSQLSICFHVLIIEATLLCPFYLTQVSSVCNLLSTNGKGSCGTAFVHLEAVLSHLFYCLFAVK